MAGHHDRTSGTPAPASEPAETLDVLSDVLRTVRLTGAVFFPMEASSPWSDEVPAAPAFAPAILPGAQHVVSYHIVTRGACWAGLRGGCAVRLEAGDVLIIPHGDPYVISSDPDEPSKMSEDDVIEFFRQMAAGSGPALVVEGGGGAEHTGLVCGFLGCDTRPFNPVLAALPRLVHLRPPPRDAPSDRLGHLIEFAMAESREQRSGAQCVLLRLSELLFIEVIRRCVDAVPADSGWLAGLRDPVVGRALMHLHHRPAAAWTLETLAHDVGISRSTLAERFTQVVGRPPMQYLAHWRMQLASRLLSESTAKVAAIAFDVGYESEAAFSRAFKKVVGVSPAAWRRRTI